MQTLNEEIKSLYGGRVRVRVSGIYLEDERILLVNHSLYGHDFWSPPGGGINFGETAEAALKREIKEETGLEAQTGKFLFVSEHIDADLHAIELFFEIQSVQGEIGKGIDPEMSADHQIIEDVQLMKLEQVQILPDGHYHSVLGKVSSLEELFRLNPFLSGLEGKA